MMTRFVAALIAAFALSGAATAAPVDTGHLVAELGAEAKGIAPGQTIHVALSQKIDKGWHTYWRNPGDSGEPTRVAWTLPAGWSAGEIIWAPPHRLPVGPLVNYGYSDTVILPMTLTAPANARPGETVTLKAAAAFLVCEDICVPEDAVLELSLPVVAAPAKPDVDWGPRIEKALAAAPKPAGLTASFQTVEAATKLAVTGAALKGAHLAHAYFFPFDGTVIDHAKPQAIDRGPEGLTLALSQGYAFQGGGAGPDTLAGVLSVGDKAYEIQATKGPAPAGAGGLGPPPAKVVGGQGPDLGLALAAVFAFLGGLILNLMPCVFPVLAMKAASLAGHAHQAAKARSQGLAFGAGVLATFLLLAGVLVALQAAGSAVGWGFQLQSPPVVAGLALLMLAVALNLFGVFEVGASLQGVGSEAASKGGFIGAFFTGALAVVVAAPCTAPFMAPALGWALTQPPIAALSIFLALGLGFAAPFVLVAFAPGLLAKLPRPGPWMSTFRKVLAFPMFGAAAWLAWVLTVQAGDIALARLLTAAVILAFAAWIAGAAQVRRAEGGKAGVLAATGAIAAVAALALAVWPSAPVEETGPAADVAYEAYSPERLAAAQAEGRPVLVNFTAAWCVTCQVNERVALSRKSVAEAMAKTNTLYLKADWTRKDAVIAAELAKHGRAGVPLYLVYGKGEPAGVILPQVLTEGIVVRALEKAAKGPSSS